MESTLIPAQDSQEKLIEFKINQWMGPLVGWRKRKLIIDETSRSYTLERTNKKKIFSTFITTTYTLVNASIHDNSTEIHSFNLTKNPKPSLQFYIQADGCTNYWKANNIKEKVEIINKLNDLIKIWSVKTGFSNEFEQYKTEIGKHSLLKSPFDWVILKFTHYQNLILEMNSKWEDFKTVLNADNMKKNKHKDEYLRFHFGLCKIKEEMKKQFDDIIEKVYDYKDYVEKEKEKNMNKNDLIKWTNAPDASEGGIENDKYNENVYNTSLNWSKWCKDINNNNEETQTTLHELEASSDDECINNTNSHDKNDWFTNISLIYSHDIADFRSEVYAAMPVRTSLVGQLKCSNSMVKEFIKAFSTKKGSLPIYFNEPWSMLQKQCERFWYSDLLKDAANDTVKERQMWSISGFIIGEIMLSLNRVLKPFNPILGETYEYIDNGKQFRFISEQVSHHPPISAFYCESLDYSCFGDTRASTSFKILKGALEVTFGNKVHVLLKKTNDYYTFNRPIMYMKGFLKGNIYNDYSGTVIIEHSVDKDVKCELTFIEENKKEFGKIDGKIFQNDKIIYWIKGNWNNEVYYTNADGEEKQVIISTDKNESYLNNTNDCYNLPSYTLNLNAISDKLKDVLPKYDSRNRPDMREYEEGKIEEAQQWKKKLEEKQSLRHLKMEEEKNKYIPKYFINEYNEQSGDYWYRYNGVYWKERKDRRWKGGNDCDIFNI